MLSEQSLEWFQKSKREMQLFQRYFTDRAKIEEKFKSQWTLFSAKWRDKFEDLLKEASIPPTLADRTRCKIMTLLLDEPVDICGSASSASGGKRQSPSGILKRWLVDPVLNTSCLGEDHFESTFHDTIDNLYISEATVNGAKRWVQEVFEEYQNARVDVTDMESVKAKRDREERLRMAKEDYQETVKDHKEMEEKFAKEMAHLSNCLESFENNRLAVLKNALDVHQTAMDKCDKEREFRKQCNEEIWGYINGMSVEESVRSWLESVKKPFHIGDFSNDPFRKDEVVDATPVRQTTDDLEVTEAKDCLEHKSEVNGNNEEDSGKKPEGNEVTEAKDCPEHKSEDKGNNEEDSALPEKSLAVEEMPTVKTCNERTNDESLAVEEMVKVETWYEHTNNEPLAVEKMPNVKTCYERTNDEFKERMVVALQDYTNVVPGHLSFKNGQKIQQLEAANSDGLGYGSVSIGKLTRRKIYGLFPVSMVKAQGKKRRFKYFFKKR